MLNLQLNNYYNISTYVPVIYGSELNNLKLVSIVDYSTALKFANIELMHKQIKPYLPTEAILDPVKYTYYRFKDSNNKEYVIADTWIIPTSIVEVAHVTINITVKNVTNADVPLLRDQLRTLGYSFDLTLS